MRHDDDEDMAAARKFLNAMRRTASMFREEDDEDANAKHSGVQRQIPGDITHLARRQGRMEAAMELLTDTVTRMSGLLTDMATTKKDLATDAKVTNPNGGEMQGTTTGNGGTPVRKTMTAAQAMDDRWIAKYSLDASKQYTTAEIDGILKTAGVEYDKRLEIKLEMEAKGMLAPAA